MAISNGVHSAVRLVIAAALAVFALPGFATTFDFTGSTSSGGGYGNVRSFTSDGITTNVTSYGATGFGGTLATAELSQWNTGLGVCNRNEGVVGGGCSTSGEHQVDGFGADDYVVFTFDQSVLLDSIVIDPYGKQDRDVKFWTGTVTLDGSGLIDLSGLTENQIQNVPDINAPVTEYNVKSTNPITIDLGLVEGNILVFKALNFNDAHKIASLEVAPVPLPAAAWLFGSALFGAGLLGRRKSQ